LRYAVDLKSRSLALVAGLDRPDPKIPPLLFAAEAARVQGAMRVGLIAPYLCYMRQDRQFQAGEAVTSRLFASLVSHSFDWLVTIDPHLHRIGALADIFGIPARAVHAGPALADWIKTEVEQPFLIGPDEESLQWVQGLAQACGAPYVVLRKTRLSDRKVVIAPGTIGATAGHTPVIVDDVISTGHTILAAMAAIAPHFDKPPIVVAVHGVFAEEAAGAIRAAGARLITTNTIAGPTAEIDIAPLLVRPIEDLI
jgi:ribose-phosphate pyrophosphokinase